MPVAGKLLGSVSPLPFASSDDDVHLTRPEAGQYLCVSVVTLERWAALGQKPELRRIGKRVVYPLGALRRFVSSDKERSPKQAQGAGRGDPTGRARSRIADNES